MCNQITSLFLKNRDNVHRVNVGIVFSCFLRCYRSLVALFGQFLDTSLHVLISADIGYLFCDLRSEAGRYRIKNLGDACHNRVDQHRHTNSLFNSSPIAPSITFAINSMT